VHGEFGELVRRSGVCACTIVRCASWKTLCCMCTTVRSALDEGESLEVLPIDVITRVDVGDDGVKSVAGCDHPR
jgi:hypothetical protein